jgi:hypothetical protein
MTQRICIPENYKCRTGRQAVPMRVPSSKQLKSGSMRHCLSAVVRYCSSFQSPTTCLSRMKGTILAASSAARAPGMSCASTECSQEHHADHTSERAAALRAGQARVPIAAGDGLPFVAVCTRCSILAASCGLTIRLPCIRRFWYAHVLPCLWRLGAQPTADLDAAMSPLGRMSATNLQVERLEVFDLQCQVLVLEGQRLQLLLRQRSSRHCCDAAVMRRIA